MFFLLYDCFALIPHSSNFAIAKVIALEDWFMAFFCIPPNIIITLSSIATDNFTEDNLGKTQRTDTKMNQRRLKAITLHKAIKKSPILLLQ
jgi:hypothetical protein